MRKQIRGFRISEELWSRFRDQHYNASRRIRELIKQDLGSEEIKLVSSGDWKAIRDYLQSCLQVTGRIGIGKTYTTKKLIQNDSKIYIVFDAHQEYNLPTIDSISTELRESSKIEMPKQVSASKGLFPLYVNQILSKKWLDQFVFVVEEAHRYPEVKLLLSEARKFAKVIAITQEPIVKFTPIVEIVKGDLNA